MPWIDSRSVVPDPFTPKITEDELEALPSKVCPNCGKLMIKDLPESGMGRLFSWRWWCGCGHMENAGFVEFEDSRMRQWRKLNEARANNGKE